MSAPDGRRELALDLGLAAILTALTVTLFAPVLSHDFVNYDDPGYVTDNPVVARGLHAEGLAWALTSFVESNWHPLTWLSHMADVSLFGLDPSGHHATSVLLHALAAALWFLVLRRWTGVRWASLWVAALFAWHPTRIESVAWVSERKDVLSGLFLVLVVIAHGASLRHRGPARRWLVGVLLALGLMAKPMLVTAPCLLLLLDVWPLGRWRPLGIGADTAGPAPDPPVQEPTASDTPSAPPETRAAWVGARRCLLDALPLLVLVAVSSAVTFAAQSEGGAVIEARRLPLSERLPNALVATAAYLRTLVWPLDLAVLYPHRPLSAAAPWLAGAVLATLSVLAWVVRRRHPALIVGWLWFLGSLVPVIGIVQVGLQSRADRYTYLPYLGLALALAFGVHGLTRGRRAIRTVGAALAILTLAACALATRRQLPHWRDSRALWEHTLAVTRDNAVAHHQLGRVLYDDGDLQAAREHYLAALEIEPRYVTALVNLGVVRDRLGDPGGAATLWRQALEIQPGEPFASGHLANQLAAHGRSAESLALIEPVAARHPDAPFVQTALGVSLARAGRSAASLAPLEHVVTLTPDDSQAWRNLALSHQALGDLPLAEAHLRRALQLDADDPVAHHLLGLVLHASGRADAAGDAWRAALRADPDFAPARAALEGADPPR